MHGYELSKQLNMLLGTFRALSYGTLYPCLTKLYAEGLITKEGDQPDSQRPARAPGRSKIVYRLTAEGKERFQDLLTHPGSGAWEDTSSASTSRSSARPGRTSGCGSWRAGGAGSKTGWKDCARRSRARASAWTATRSNCSGTALKPWSAMSAG